ncbi:TPA: helix-turn-helix transcriptional regulator [Vibrio parahaemolyticus]|uniref:helix-turn-helix domain-containing protein n=1 Tax=Vibrio campbellii TaxID=680 RepID=UPI001F0790CC|nr:helix-turn-helix transcriptional regulator [Vibrio campbellii]UMM06608.1 helix-turn-helix domain-containing protein [Vibrio campbellii]
MKFKLSAMVGATVAITLFGSAAVAGGSHELAELPLTGLPSIRSWLSEHPWIIAILGTTPGIAIFAIVLWLHHNKKLGNARDEVHVERLNERHSEYQRHKPIQSPEELEAATKQFSIELGKRIHSQLEVVGISNHALAQTAGMSKSDLEQVLQGKHPLSTSECFVIAKALGLTIQQLMSDLESDK